MIVETWHAASLLFLVCFLYFIAQHQKDIDYEKDCFSPMPPLCIVDFG